MEQENSDFWQGVNSKQVGVPGSFRPEHHWLGDSELYLQVCSRWQQGPLQVSNVLGWHLGLVCCNPVLEGLTHIVQQQQKDSSGKKKQSYLQGDCQEASPTYPPPGPNFCFEL